MKTRILFLLLLLFTFAITSQAQPPVKFTSGDGGFDISLPKEGFTVEDTPEDEAGLGYGKRYTWQIAGDKVFIVTYYVASDTPMTLKYKNALAEGIITGFVKGSEAKGYQVSRKPYVFKGNRGVEFRVTMPGVISVTRFFITPTRIYLVQVTMKAPTAEAELAGTKTLDSLRLLTRPEIVAAKLFEAEPEILPQGPAPNLDSTDTRDHGLKGMVQSVIEEKGTSAKVPRTKVSEKYYDRRGLLTRKLDYDDDGYPSTIYSYGFIDGMRVVKTGDIYFDSDQRPFARKEIIQSIMESPRDPSMEPPPAPPPEDKRYSYRYIYKYDSEKRLISEIELDNTGEPFPEKVTEYFGNSRKKFTRDPEGTDFENELHVLDKDGNVTQLTLFDDDTGKPTQTVNYSYSFDTAGNWIVRRATEKVMVRGKLIVKNLDTHYRTIVYYK